MTTRKLTSLGLAALVALLAMSQAGGAMTLRTDAEMVGNYLFIDEYKVIYWDGLGDVIQTVEELEPWQPIVGTTSFTCFDPVAGCVVKGGRCDWTGETDDYAGGGSAQGTLPEWWETVPSEADLRWGVCAITSIRTEEGTGDVIVQYRAGLRATSKVNALNGGTSQIWGTWKTHWSVYWVNGDGDEVTAFSRLANEESPNMCKVNPLGNSEEYEGFRDPLNQLDFATCVWDPSRIINISDAYAALPEGDDKRSIAGFKVRAILDNLDDGRDPFEAPDSCPCGIS